MSPLQSEIRSVEIGNGSGNYSEKTMYIRKHPYPFNTWNKTSRSIMNFINYCIYNRCENQNCNQKKFLRNKKNMSSKSTSGLKTVPNNYGILTEYESGTNL